MNLVTFNHFLNENNRTAATAERRLQRTLVATKSVLQRMETGQPVRSSDLRAALIEAFDSTDAEGAWDWKQAYEACEAAQVLFLQKYGHSILGHAANPQAVLAMLTKMASLLPTHARRSDESQALQQLSTPLPLAFVAAQAAGLSPADVVLEPSAGTGMLAVFAAITNARLFLNEVADLRAELLETLFPKSVVTKHDAAHIDDYLNRAVQPTVVLMNPPFSAGIHVDGRVTDAAWRHLSSAFARLAPGGRLVAITGSALSPDSGKWGDKFVQLQGEGRVVFSAALAGRAYARHGTTAETGLTVIDKLPPSDPTRIVASRGLAPDIETLLDWLGDLPARADISQLLAGSATAGSEASCSLESVAAPVMGSARACNVAADVSELGYELRDVDDRQFLSPAADGVYEPYRLQSIHIPNARPHPDTLIVQIVSTGEALTERRLAQIPPADWNDIQVDVTPREYVLDYLMHSFPTQLFEEFSDGEGNLSSRPVYDASGQPVLCREAVRRRDDLIEKLGSLKRFRPRSTRSSSILARRWWWRSPAARAGSCASRRDQSSVMRSRTARALQTSTKRGRSWTIRSRSWCFPTPAARVDRTMPI